MDWQNIIGSIAPTVATALGGPLAGLGVEAIGKALGIEQPTIKRIQDALSQGQLTGDQIAQLKQAEMNLLSRMKELDIQEEQFSYADRDSARKMQIATPSLIPPTIAIVVVSLVFLTEGMLLFGSLPPHVDGVVLGRIMGTLDSALILVLSFYFGSSSSSERKTELLAQQGPQK